MSIEIKPQSENFSRVEHLYGRSGILAVEDEIIPMLKEIRMRNGLSQNRTAKKAGIFQPKLNEIENLKNTNPEVATLLKYTAAVDPELAIALVVINRNPQILAAGSGIIPTLVSIALELRLSQTEIAKRYGTTQSAISELESEKVAPRLRTMNKYLSAIDPRLRIALIDTRV